MIFKQEIAYEYEEWLNLPVRVMKRRKLSAGMKEVGA